MIEYVAFSRAGHNLSLLIACIFRVDNETPDATGPYRAVAQATSMKVTCNAVRNRP
jgi:hypothetical protein